MPLPCDLARTFRVLAISFALPSLPAQVMAVLMDHFLAATAVEKRKALRNDEEAALRRRVRGRARRGGGRKGQDRWGGAGWTKGGDFRQFRSCGEGERKSHRRRGPEGGSPPPSSGEPHPLSAFRITCPCRSHFNLAVYVAGIPQPIPPPPRPLALGSGSVVCPTPSTTLLLSNFSPSLLSIVHTRGSPGRPSRTRCGPCSRTSAASQTRCARACVRLGDRQGEERVKET